MIPSSPTTQYPVSAEGAVVCLEASVVDEDVVFVADLEGAEPSESLQGGG